MNIYFINPPFKAEFGKFSRESRSPAITKSGALYYPLWLIYAALYSSKQGHNVSFLDAPAKQLNEEQSLNIIRKTDNEHSLFVLAYIIHSGFISGYQNRYGDNLKPPTNVYHRMTA